MENLKKKCFGGFISLKIVSRDTSFEVSHNDRMQKCHQPKKELSDLVKDYWGYPEKLYTRPHLHKGPNGDQLHRPYIKSIEHYGNH